MQQVVRLLGDLGERYGAKHVYHDLRTPADAIKLLSINYPEFRNELLTAHEKGIGYRVLQAGVDLKLDELKLPIGQNDLVIAPVLTGSDGEFFAGVALIGLSFIPGLQGIALVGGSTAATAVGAIGVSLVLGSVSQMLSPQPFIGTRQEFDATQPEAVTRGFDGQQSYAYLGAQNTVGVGATIPVAYGRVLIGSHVISADVDVADESDPIRKATRTPSNDTVTINGSKLEFGQVLNNMGRWSSSVHFQLDRSSTADVFTAPKRDDKLTAANFIELEFGDQGTQDPDNYFVALEVNNLFREVSGPGTTKTDGFISYMIESREFGTDIVNAREAFTIQGLSTDSYRYFHKFDPNKASGVDFYSIDVTILDASANSSTTMRIQHGFNPVFS